ncbi:unnamed protein product [Lymnaea stagnalis]|uniref:Uncharacterized protein n=1 Tax=Lymnaea stagnalis TaxID=6523 RepID=A0AAV2IH12_LYMST
MKLLGLLVVLGVGSWAAGDDSEPRKEPSQRLLTFLSLFNGYFSSAKEVKAEKAELGYPVHDVINATFRNVFVPALPNEITFYLEEEDNGVVYRMQILVIREDELGIIRIAPYNFTDTTKYKPGQFDVTKDLENVRLEELSPTRPDCEIVFMQTDVNVFVGTFPDCTRWVDGGHPKYAFTLSCRTITALVYWGKSREKDSLLPYDHRKIVSYPLLPYVAPGAENFKPPCNCS